jgi:hypothetical protein
METPMMLANGPVEARSRQLVDTGRIEQAPRNAALSLKLPCPRSSVGVSLTKANILCEGSDLCCGP